MFPFEAKLRRNKKWGSGFNFFIICYHISKHAFFFLFRFFFPLLPFGFLYPAASLGVFFVPYFSLFLFFLDFHIQLLEKIKKSWVR